MKAQLAIVIPAYKADFFDACLASIARQTCREFTLYIGDDASKSDLKAIADKYSSDIQISYTRFPQNMGGVDLIGHWNRCIDLIADEEWVWMFSDDDEMHPECVRDFYRYKEQFPNFDIFHFNMIRINEKGDPLGDKVTFNDTISKEDLLIGRLRSTMQTTVVEYIFRRNRFIAEGYFQKFDLAWGSDDATWMKLARFTGIKNIPESTVYWRYSNVNISTQNQNHMIIRKLYARIDFAHWVLQEYPAASLQMEISTLRRALRQWFERFLTFGSPVLTIKEIRQLLAAFYQTVPGNRICFQYRLMSILLSKGMEWFKCYIKKFIKS